MAVTLTKGQPFSNRAEISRKLGGDSRSGITTSTKIKAILLFKNEDELYSDYFYPKGTDAYCMYTGIGRNGHQDGPNNKRYYGLNIEVLNHAKLKKPLLLFEKVDSGYCFVGEYLLTETHQNIQPDDHNVLRRVFVFHLKKISDTITLREIGRTKSKKNNKSSPSRNAFSR